MKLTASAEGKIEIERFILILNLGLSIALGFSGCTYMFILHGQAKEW